MFNPQVFFFCLFVCLFVFVFFLLEKCSGGKGDHLDAGEVTLQLGLTQTKRTVLNLLSRERSGAKMSLLQTLFRKQPLELLSKWNCKSVC